MTSVFTSDLHHHVRSSLDETKEKEAGGELSRPEEGPVKVQENVGGRTAAIEIPDSYRNAFHTHPVPCDDNEGLQCGIPTPSLDDMEQFLRALERGRVFCSHTIFSRHGTFVVYHNAVERHKLHAQLEADGVSFAQWFEENKKVLRRFISRLENKLFSNGARVMHPERYAKLWIRCVDPTRNCPEEHRSSKVKKLLGLFEIEYFAPGDTHSLRFCPRQSV